MAYLPGRKKPEDKELRRQPAREERADLRPDIDVEKLQKAYTDLEEAVRQLRESHIELILNLAIAAEYKDPDTGSHILRISDYSTELAKAIGLQEDQIDILRYASPMHDIGKIGIPDSILQKPGKLTPEEWVVMKQHTVIGSRIFKNSHSPLLRAVSEISISHHEKYDGTGYPSGIRGKDIPIFGRIVAVVDVFDAVVSKRCYKEAASFNEGFEYIRSLAGNHLDPDLVGAFVRIRDRVQSIYDANRNIQNYIAEFGEQI